VFDVDLKKLRKNPRFRIVMMAVYVAVILSVVYSLSSSFVRLKTHQATLRSLTVQEKKLKKEQKELEKEVEQLKDDDYVIRYARDHYIFSAENEKVIILPSDEDDESKKS